MVSDLRLSIFDLRSGVDESVGLATALGDYVSGSARRPGLSVHVSIDESGDRLPVAAEVELLRMVQEGVTNVRSTPGPEPLADPWCRPPRARIIVADDGKGLGKAAPGQHRHHRDAGASAAYRGSPEYRDTPADGGTLVAMPCCRPQHRRGSVNAE